VLIHPWDAGLDDDEWRSFVSAQGFGHLLASGRDRDVPVAVPTQLVLAGEHVLLHLARPNPVWAAIEENPRVLVAVAGDWAYVPAAWKVIGEEDPALGIPTTFYAAVQLTGSAEVLDQPADVAAILRTQLGTYEPGSGVADPAVAHTKKLRAIRGLRITIEDVRAKLKYGGNQDPAHRAAIAARLAARGGPNDAAALAHLSRRTPLC
jgi:transcriptional regulator